MNRLSKIVYILFFIATAASAQVKRVQFISDENHLPLSNVEVYDGNSLIGKSDPNGFLDVKTGDSNSLHIIKDDYQDAFMKVVDLQEKVTLVKNKPIELREVVIGKKAHIGVRKILNRALNSLDRIDGSIFFDQGKYKLPRYFNATNKLLMQTDTLHYLNGLMNYENRGSWVWRIDKNFQSVKRFKYVSVKSNYNQSYKRSVYSINHKDVEFYECSTSFYSMDDDNVLSRNILEKRSNYVYTVTDIGDCYKVEFVFKNKSPFKDGWLFVWRDWRESVGFNGCLLIDKKDFGILEFKAHLSDPSNKYLEHTPNVSTINVNQKYLTTGIDYYIKYQKDKDGNYQLMRYLYDEQIEQTQGNFKGKKFYYSRNIEATDNYKNTEFIGFNPYSYELK